MSGNELRVRTPPDIQERVFEELGRYVYLLVDPDDSRPFYVGKGTRDRPVAHQWEAMVATDEATATERAEEIDPLGDDDEEQTERRRELSRKITKIREITSRPDNQEPEIWIVRHGLSKAEYTAVEAATIDLLSSFPIQPAGGDKKRIPLVEARLDLTNLRREKSLKHGMVLLETLIQEYSVDDLPADIPPVMTIALGTWRDTSYGEPVPWGSRLGHGYKQEWLQTESRLKHLDDIAASAAAWFYFAADAFDQDRRYAVAVHRGVTRALMWVEPGSVVESHYGPAGNGSRRRGFKYRVVRPAEDVLPGESELYEKIIGAHGKRLDRNFQNSVYYWPR